jgi:hypothetical protein
MTNKFLPQFSLLLGLLFAGVYSAEAQNKLKLKYKNSIVYAGIEVGSKGVKMSLLEIGKNAKKNGAFNIVKDTSINTDFISFTQPTFQATVNGMSSLYSTALNTYNIPPERIFTVVSSGVKVQAEKEDKSNWISNFVDSVRIKIHDPNRTIEVVDVIQEARLSHLGIVPESKRFTTFLIDIGSGNTKGGYFPGTTTKDMKLFQLSWGTKSTANAAEKRIDDDKSIGNYEKQLSRVLAGAINTEVIYAVNSSGAYNMSDNIAFSGGIAWSVATLMFPEMIDNSVLVVNFDDLLKFNEKLSANFSALSESSIVKGLKGNVENKDAIAKEVRTVHKVFDQRSLMAGTGLLIKIMRQFVGIYEKKQFFLVKNGQVGWISAYVDQSIVK